MSATSLGTWAARYQYKDGKRKNIGLSDFSGLPKSEQYDAAKREAEAWFAHIDQGGSVARVTLREACEAYANSLELKGESGARSANDVRQRFSRYVFDDARFVAKELDKLTRHDLSTWRQRLQTEVTKTGAIRKASTLNRDMTCVRAALNFAFEQGWVASDASWRVVLKPISSRQNSTVADRREEYLSVAERRRLIDSSSYDLQQFIKAMCLLPLRPGALASLRVEDFNKSRSSLTIPKDKAGQGRLVPLPQDALSLIRAQCATKLPSAQIFTRLDGTPWNKDNWKKPLRLGARKAGLSDSIVMYTLRHSVITDMVHAGVPLLTIAQLAGTSVRMIEQHYGHLRQEAALEALSELKI